MQACRVGQHGLLVECATSDEVAAAHAALRTLVEERRDELGATDLVPAARTVLLDGLRDVESALRLVAGLAPPPVGPALAEGPVVEVPVTYDGPDLAEVARQWEVDTAEVARIHIATDFVVAFCGFAPGFAYCTGLPEELTVRRRAEPRARVPAGAVALAGEYASVYPSASPGGWQLIGTTSLQVWRPDADRPALLAPGTRVRFVDA